MDWRRLFSTRPEAGPGEDSRDCAPKPGERDLTEVLSESALSEGECGRPAGEVERDMGLDNGRPTWGSDLLRPRGPEITKISHDQMSDSLNEPTGWRTQGVACMVHFWFEAYLSGNGSGLDVDGRCWELVCLTHVRYHRGMSSVRHVPERLLRLSGVNLKPWSWHMGWHSLLKQKL